MRVLKGSRSVGRARWVYGGPVGLKGVRWGRRGRVGWGCKSEYEGDSASCMSQTIIDYIRQDTRGNMLRRCIGHASLSRCEEVKQKDEKQGMERK